MIAKDDEQMRIIDEYTRKHNVSMIALGSVMERAGERNMVDELCIEDVALNVELFLYDLTSIYECMSDNMQSLWEITDKYTLERLDDKRDAK